MNEELLTSSYGPLPLGAWGGLILIVIMFAMGLSLRWRDFGLVFARPRAVLTGLALQLVVLPLLGFALASGMAPNSAVAIGIVLLCVAPGGPPSNLLTFLAHGDVALSVSLTAVSSLVTVFTIPLLVNLGLAVFGDGSATVSLPVVPSMARVFGITGVPMLLGMAVLRYAPGWAGRIQRPLTRASFVVLIVIFSMFCHAMWPWLGQMLEDAGVVALTLHVVTLGLGYFGAKAMGLRAGQCRTIAIEVGLQNCLLGFVIAFTMLGRAELAVVPMVYLVVMNVGLLVYVTYAHFAFRGQSSETSG
ncbi:MAG: bile acid:sodium symporter family protein [Nannocystaceae bacterium]